MSSYKPTAVTYQNSGLVKSREAFVLADDAYQELTNIYQWRGRLKRRNGYDLLGRLRRAVTEESKTAADGTNDYNLADILSAVRATEASAELSAGTVNLIFDLGGGNETTFTDTGTGLWTRSAGTAYDLYTPPSISTISNAASAVIDFGAAHQFATNNQVLIQGVVGMEEINNRVGTVTATTANTITVNINSSAMGTYSSGGTANGSFILYETGKANLTFDSGSTPPNTTTVDATYAYFPSLPVMGLGQRLIPAINAEETIAFDQKYAYSFNNTSNVFTQIGSVSWAGEDYDFFYTTNYWFTTDGEPYLWVTNFGAPATNPIRVYDGTAWTTFNPTTNGSNEMYSARILIPYKGRMVALNTREGATSGTTVQYPNRARWSQNGAPFSAVAAGANPTATQEWRDDIKGRGGYVDCPTSEHIISADFVRDTLIVGFESSTWALRYTGNEILPFVWDRINRELGTEGTFSTVPFDRGLLSVGDKSINICDGNGVERIDEKIPDEVFQIHNTFDGSSKVSDGPLRVHGTRDFFEKLVYWTFPDAATSAKFPDRVLVYNYDAKNWALFTDSFTCFGVHRRFNDLRWQDLVDTSWQQANFAWASAKLQSQFPNTIAGNQQGYVLVLDQKVTNDESLTITGITGGSSQVSLEVTNHNLDDGDYVYVSGCLGTGELELNDRVFSVNVTDADNITLDTKPRFDITAITQAAEAVVTAPGHTFSVGDHWYIDRVSAGMTEISGLSGIVNAVSGSSVKLDVDSSTFTAYTSGGSIQNLDDITIAEAVPARTYIGQGRLRRIMNFRAVSKKFNLIDQGKSLQLGYLDFLTQTTDDGEIACDIYIDYQDDIPINDGSDTFFNVVFDTQSDPLSPLAKTKDWHRFYCNTECQFFQYDLNLNERQMFTLPITSSEVLIDSIIIWATASGRLVGP